MLNKSIRALICLGLAGTVYATDQSSLIADEISAQFANLSPTPESCEQKPNDWTFTRFQLSVAPSVSFGIHDVLEVSIAPEVVFIWVKKGHEPD